MVQIQASQTLEVALCRCLVQLSLTGLQVFNKCPDLEPLLSSVAPFLEIMFSQIDLSDISLNGIIEDHIGPRLMLRKAKCKLQILEETSWYDTADSCRICLEAAGRDFCKAVLRCNTCGFTRFVSQTLPGTTNRAAKRLESLSQVSLANPATNSQQSMASRLLGALTQAGMVFMNLSLAQQIPFIHGRSKRIKNWVDDMKSWPVATFRIQLCTPSQISLISDCVRCPGFTVGASVGS
jgi:hypothetical protein